jgi:small-conductance mechanosensitive channel
MELKVQQLWQQTLGIFGTNPWVRALIIILAALVLARLVDWLLGRVLAAWAKKSQTDLDDRLLTYLHKPVFVSVVLSGLWLALGQIELPAGLTRLYQRGIQTVALLVWLVFFYRCCSIVLDILSHLQRKVSLIHPKTVPLFEKTLKILLVGGSIYFLFLIWGIDVAGYLVSAGIIGIAIGFAAKDTLANLFSGIFILADAPYQVGDFIVLDSGERGRVTMIGLRSTRLLTRDDIEITVPNAVIANAKIVNETGGPWEKERVRVQVSVAYGSDIDQVRRILLDIAHSEPAIDQQPEPRVRFRSFGDSGLNLELLGWIHEPVLRGRVLDSLNSEVYKRFASEGIEIPYPKRDVYLRQAQRPAKTASGPNQRTG